MGLTGRRIRGPALGFMFGEKHISSFLARGVGGIGEKRMSFGSCVAKFTSTGLHLFSFSFGRGGSVSSVALPIIWRRAMIIKLDKIEFLQCPCHTLPPHRDCFMLPAHWFFFCHAQGKMCM